MNIKSTIKKISLIVVVGFYLFLATYFWRDIAAAVMGAKSFFVLLVVLALLGIVAQARSYFMMLPSFYRQNFPQIVWVWSLSSLTNYISPFSPGIGVRHLYFNRLGLSHKELLGKTICWLLGSIYLAFFIGLMAVLGIKFGWWVIPASLIFFAFITPVIRRSLRYLHVVLAGVVGGSWRQELVASLVLPPTNALVYSAAQYIVTSVSYYLALKVCGVEADIFRVVLISCGALFLTLLPLMPNGLGVVDSVFGGFALSHGANPGEALSVVVLLRAASLIACLVLLVFCSFRSRDALCVWKN